MLQMGAGELLLVGIVGLFVLGPKELPVVARHLARLAGKLSKHWQEARDGFTRLWHE